MRTIRHTTRFKRDYRRELSGVQGRKIEAILREALEFLVEDRLLPPRNRDHALSGEWSDCRDCHLRPDLVLIYRKVGADTLDLVRLGSHAELGL